ncbi:MAG: glycosyltransferase family 4 protein [archaeon]
MAAKGNRMILPLTKKIFSLMKKNRYDLMHAHCPFTLASCIPARFYYSIPIIATIHGNWVNCIKGRRYFEGMICSKRHYSNSERCAECLNQKKSVVKLKQFMLKNLTENCNLLIAVSSDVGNSIELNKRIPIKVIPNVSSKVRGLGKRKARKELGVELNKKIILFVGSLIEEKGPMVLLKAAKNILKKHKNTELHLIHGYCEKPYLGKIKNYIKKEKLKGKVFFHSNIPNKEVRKTFIPASDLVVLPSLWPEPCSSIVTEAMNASVPVIASRIGGFKDLIEEGVDGILFKSGDSNELSRKINSLLGDKEKQRKIKKNSLKKFNECLNWIVVSEKIVGVYKKTLSEK